MSTVVGVPKETAGRERRVALVPDVVGRLLDKNDGLSVRVEQGAGEGALIDDAAFEEAGAEVVPREEVWTSDVILTVQPPGDDEFELLGGDSILIGMLDPLNTPQRAQKLANSGVTAISMELIPRITRAQRMDVLSAMSTVVGYRATIRAADRLPKFFPLLTTAAGTVQPSRVLVLGAGVAGLQAIATAKRLGAVVSGYDIREATREQVESLGASFVELDVDVDAAETEEGYAEELAKEKQEQQVELLVDHIADHDIVISTAAIPGRPAPLLISEEAVQAMSRGSVIIDVAASTGGNCALTEPGEVVSRHGVEIHGPTNLPAEMPVHASQMYARTISALVEDLLVEGEVVIDLDDEILENACVTYEGEVVNERVKELL